MRELLSIAGLVGLVIVVDLIALACMVVQAW